MLTKPNLPEQLIVDQLRHAFNWPVTDLIFLPLDADRNTAVYRAATSDGRVYFIKVRLGDFRSTSVTIPDFLYQQGMRQLIPPLATQNGQLWMALDSYQIIAYPFVPGQTGYTHGMTTAHWADFGSAIHQLHATTLPAHLASVIPHEDFAPIWPERMRTLLQSAPANADEPVVQALVHFLLEKINELSELIDFTERLADTLRSSPLAFVLCHGDMHGWNLLIDNDDRLFIVDWDTLILAPKERDLMFIGGGHGDSGYRAEEEEMLFYRGYGKTLVNHDALAYYRFARALEDIVLFAEQILSTDNDDNAEDRQQALHYLQSNFLPESTIAQAYRALYDSSRLGPSDDSMQSGKAKQRWST